MKAQCVHQDSGLCETCFNYEISISQRDLEISSLKTQLAGERERATRLTDALNRANGAEIMASQKIKKLEKMLNAKCDLNADSNESVVLRQEIASQQKEINRLQLLVKRYAENIEKAAEQEERCGSNLHRCREALLKIQAEGKWAHETLCKDYKPYDKCAPNSICYVSKIAEEALSALDEAGIKSE